MSENESSDAPWQLHYKMIRQLYEKADANESAIANSNKELQKATSVFRAKTEVLPAAIASDVKRDLAAAYAGLERNFNAMSTAVGDQIISKLQQTNIKAEQAEAAYVRAAKFAVWKVSFTAIVVSAIPFLVLYFVFLPDLKDLRTEERELTEQVERLKSNAELLKQIEGVNSIYSCPDGNIMRRCIQTDESAFGGKAYPPGQPGRVTYRAIFGVKP